MKSRLVALGIAALLSATGAQAAGWSKGTPYVGAEFGTFHIKANGNSDSKTAGDIYLGYAFSKYLGVQLNLGASTYAGNVRLRHYESLYVRGTLPFQQRFSLYGLAGYTRAEVNTRGGDYKHTKGSFSYGAGIEFYGTRNTAFTLSYTQIIHATYPGGNDVSSNAASIGLIHYFGWPTVQ